MKSRASPASCGSESSADDANAANQIADDPNAPALPSTWTQQLGAVGLSVKKADDLLRQPFGMKTAADFVNLLSDRGGAVLISQMTPEVLAQCHDRYMRLRDASEGRPQPLDWTALALTNPPERSWALYMWIAMRCPTLLVGGGGTGKTLLMLQIGACLSIARRFISSGHGRSRS